MANELMHLDKIPIQACGLGQYNCDTAGSNPFRGVHVRLRIYALFRSCGDLAEYAPPPTRARGSCRRIE